MIFATTEFPKIAISFDAEKEPFFQEIVLENLRLLKAMRTSRALLAEIAAATPAFRGRGEEQHFNVIIQPPLRKQLSAPGLAGSQENMRIGDQAKYDDWYCGKNGKLQPSLDSKVSSQEGDKAAARNGTGSFCYLFFSTYEMLSKDGTWLYPHITMGHELIHCLHALKGITKEDDKQEEYFTVGIKGYEGEAMTENKIRADFPNIPPRTKYFATD
jgi:hypothetical protein